MTATVLMLTSEECRVRDEHVAELVDAGGIVWIAHARGCAYLLGFRAARRGQAREVPSYFSDPAVCWSWEAGWDRGAGGAR